MGSRDVFPGEGDMYAEIQLGSTGGVVKLVKQIRWRGWEGQSAPGRGNGTFKGPVVGGGVDKDSGSLPRKTPTPGSYSLEPNWAWRAGGHWEGKRTWNLAW